MALRILVCALGALVFGCAPMSPSECAETQPPSEDVAGGGCYSVAQLTECESTELGTVEFEDGQTGYCCQVISRECPPE